MLWCPLSSSASIRSCVTYCGCPPNSTTRLMLNLHTHARLGQLPWKFAQLIINRDMTAAAASTAKSTYNVPEGHHGSDLSSTACHIGLGRRRDLTMRQDLRLWDGERALTLAEVFHNFRALLVGFPGGKVCTEQHIPSYVKGADQLGSLGVDKVVCVTAAQPEQVKQWTAQHGFDKQDKIQVLSDRNGSFIRLLGLELGPEGPPCQRFAGVVDSGILLRLKVEQHPADLKVTDIRSMMQTFKDAYA